MRHSRCLVINIYLCKIYGVLMTEDARPGWIWRCCKSLACAGVCKGSHSRYPKSNATQSIWNMQVMQDAHCMTVWLEQVITSWLLLALCALKINLITNIKGQAAHFIIKWQSPFDRFWTYEVSAGTRPGAKAQDSDFCIPSTSPSTEIWVCKTEM